MMHKPALFIALLFGWEQVLGASGCWVDFFDEPDFSGPRVRIEGPTELPNLHALEGADWDDRIDSLEVGPGAEVTLYMNEGFQVPETPINHPHAIKQWGGRKDNYLPGVKPFSAGHKIHHLGEYGLHDQVSSLKVICTGQR